MKKTLSIILAILMIVTTIPFAFAADDILDFSDAKILTSDADGNLYIDGKVVSNRYIPGGKYKLGSDMKTDKNCFWIKEGNNVLLDLNGYTWDLVTNYLIVECELSVYDTSANESGKLVSSESTIQPYESNKLNIYGGTIETTAAEQAIILIDTELNLYGGKIKSNKNAVSYRLFDDTVINLYGTVFECGENYGEFSASLYDGTYAEVVLDVSHYTGDSLTVDANISEAGKIVIFEGIEDAEAAENFKINYTINESYGIFYEETVYDEATGEKYVSVIRNTFTQQPSADNNLTVDFNNSAATFQWYEVEEKNLGTYIAEEARPLFLYDFKAGDVLKTSTDSELEFVVIEAGNEYIELIENEKTAITTFDADTTVDFFTAILDADNPVEINFTLINETKLDGETEKTLQKVECGKSYYCKATVGENVYVSDNVNILSVEHNLIQVDAKAPTCTEIGWEAYEYCTACDYTTYVEIPALGHADADSDGVCDNGCGAEVVTLGGNVYPVDGDITNTGIYIGAFAAFDNCYKAGDGYILIKGEGNDDTVMTLYNATIDVRGTGHKDAIKVDGEDIEIRFIGENNIFADEEAYITAIGSNRHSQTFIGADDAVLNLYGNVAVSDINIESGTVNVYGADVNDIESVYVEGYLVISDGAVLNIISGDNGQGFNCGIIAQKEIVAEGEFNAIALTGVETDNESIYNLTAIGNAVLGADTYNPYYGMEFPEDFNFEINFIVPEGTSVTVPEGITLNLDTMTNVDIDGELIVYGTLICTHTGGEDTCDAPAVCDICKQVYGEKLTHTDEDGDYICDHGCGYEYEKPEEPTPEEPTPEEPEDETCADCGKVHTNFFSEIICFFTRIINFIKNLFE